MNWIYRLSKSGKENGISAIEMSSEAEERLKRLEEGNEIIQRFIFTCSYVMWRLCELLNVITSRPDVFNHINWMTTITDDFYWNNGTFKVWTQKVADNMYSKLYLGIIFNISQVQKLDNRLNHLGNHVTETEKFLAKKTDEAISGMTRWQLCMTQNIRHCDFSVFYLSNQLLRNHICYCSKHLILLNNVKLE